MKWECNECGELIDEEAPNYQKSARHAVEKHGGLEEASFSAVSDAELEASK